MQQISPAFPGLADIIRRSVSCGAVYPLSVARQYQHGLIFSDSADSFLILHDCGFAFAVGSVSEHFLGEIYEMLLHPANLPSGRMLLFAEADDTEAFFRAKPGLTFSRRLFFSYPETKQPSEPVVCKPYEIRAMSAELLRSVKGRITPAFSWQSPETFQQNGMGFCAVCGDIPAGWAFSAAVSDNEIDIGVETAAEHRRNGLAEACAAAMIQEILRRGKTPVWACAEQNAASAALACKLGFVPAGKCTVIQAVI